MSDRGGDGKADDEDGFLQRWSRRKRGVEAGDAPPEAGVDLADAESDAGPVMMPLGAGRMIVEPSMLYPAPEADEDAEAAHAEDDGASNESDSDKGQSRSTGAVSEEDITALEAIDIDAMDYDADFTPFMRAGVPDVLRRRALRKLWSTNPILANLDGMNDYDEDFTDAKLAVAVLKTAFKPIGGYMTDEEIAAQERLGREHEYDEDGNWIGEQTEVADADGTETKAESEDDDRVADAGDATAEAALPTEGEAAADEDDDDLDDDGDTDFG